MGLELPKLGADLTGDLVLREALRVRPHRRGVPVPGQRLLDAMADPVAKAVTSTAAPF